MKITDEIVRALQKAINNKGSVDAAAKSTNVKTETLSQFLNRSTNSIRKETWDKLYPLIKPYMPPEKNEAEKSDPPELPEPPSPPDADEAEGTILRKVRGGTKR